MPLNSSKLFIDHPFALFSMISPELPSDPDQLIVKMESFGGITLSMYLIKLIVPVCGLFATSIAILGVVSSTTNVLGFGLRSEV